MKIHACCSLLPPAWTLRMPKEHWTRTWRARRNGWIQRYFARTCYVVRNSWVRLSVDRIAVSLVLSKKCSNKPMYPPTRESKVTVELPGFGGIPAGEGLTSTGITVIADI